MLSEPTQESRLKGSEPRTREARSGPFNTTIGEGVAALASIVALVVVLLGQLVSPVASGLFCVVLGGMCVAVAADMKLRKKLFRNLPGDNEGHVMVEFGLGYSFVLLLLAGTIGFGHLFYVYNSAQSAVRSAARFASLEAYDLPQGTQWKAAVKNMAVYGTPVSEGSPDPLVYGFSPANITVTANTIEGIPESVLVEAQFDVQTPFINFSVSQPRVTFPYLGKITSP